MKNRKTVVFVLVLAAFLAHVGVAIAQEDDVRQHRAPNHPMNFPASDAEIRVALRGTDEPLKEVTIGRAALVPANTLRPATVKAIGDEIIALRADNHRRFMEDPLSVNEGNNHFEYIVALAQVLINQKNTAGIDGLAAVVDIGQPIYALIEFGEAAVPALVKAASKDNSYGHDARAMDALSQMLRKPTIRRTISPRSLSSIRQIAAQKLASVKGDDYYTLVEAVYLAVALGDDQLRKQVADLIDNDREFVRRGISVEGQQVVSEGARKALAESNK